MQYLTGLLRWNPHHCCPIISLACGFNSDGIIKCSLVLSFVNLRFLINYWSVLSPFFVNKCSNKLQIEHSNWTQQKEFFICNNSYTFTSISLVVIHNTCTSHLLMVTVSWAKSMVQTVNHIMPNFWAVPHFIPIICHTFIQLWLFATETVF